MDTPARNLRRSQLRKTRKNETRRDSLIAEYIQHKYKHVYSEAHHFYAKLNNRHPTKYDLRKTEEYKYWKSGLISSIESPQNLSFLNNQTPFEDRGEQHESPLPSPHSTEQESSPSTSNHTQQESSPSTSNHTQQESPPPRQQLYTDSLQLRIPLLDPQSISNGTNCNTGTTETLSIITEQVLEEDTQQSPLYQEQPFTVQIPGEDTLQPSLSEVIPPDVIQKVIDELRSDPDLQDMFDIEQQLQFKELGADIDIPEDDLLEKELENWSEW